jgi:hypothetical protein
MFANGAFKSTIEFIEKYLLGHLEEYQQFGFVRQYQDLKVGTGPTGKAGFTRIVLFTADEISSIGQLISVLDDVRGIYQLHLLLLYEGTAAT